MKKTNIKALTGGAAAAEALRQIHPDVMAVYPITPQTPIIETYAKMQADGLVATEIVQVESEHSAMSATMGASAAGVRAITATSSQGLLYMHEVLPIVSGSRLPVMMYVSARAISAPLNIHGEHGDVMAVRDAGWVQIFSQDAQDAYDNGIIAMKLAEAVQFPTMPIMDGFHTSHMTERVEILDDAVVKEFVGEYKPEQCLMHVDDPISFGPLALQNTYFEFKIDQSNAFQKVTAAYKKICKEYAKISGRRHEVVEEYRVADAESVIVMMGATAGTAKEVVDSLREKGQKVGLLNVKLYRPFPYKEVGHALAHVKHIAVLDRAMSVGAYPPLYQDVVVSMQGAGSRKHDVASYIYGLGGRDTFQKDIEQVFHEIKNEPKHNTMFIN